MESQDKKQNNYWLSPEEIKALHEDAERTQAILDEHRKLRKEGKHTKI